MIFFLWFLNCKLIDIRETILYCANTTIRKLYFDHKIPYRLVCDKLKRKKAEKWEHFVWLYARIHVITFITIKSLCQGYRTNYIVIVSNFIYDLLISQINLKHTRENHKNTSHYERLRKKVNKKRLRKKDKNNF